MHDHSTDAVRVQVFHPPFSPIQPSDWGKRGRWPAGWISLEDDPKAPFVAAYRLQFQVDHETEVRIHVTADERYELYLDGRLIGRGSERGDENNWFFESYDIFLGEGEHQFTAKVWTFGGEAPYAQHSVGHGFLLASEGDLSLSTGTEPWEAKRLPGFGFLNSITAWGTGLNTLINAREFDWDWLTEASGGWAPAIKTETATGAVGANEFGPTHLLTPATLPPQYSERTQTPVVRNVSALGTSLTSPIPILQANNLSQEQSDWTRLLHGVPLEVAAQTRIRVLLDFENYVCAYPELLLSGGNGARVRVHWQESLFNAFRDTDKGNRDEVEGKFFTTMWHWTDGIGDLFIADGGRDRHFRPLWWQAGRYVEILIETEEEPLTIESLHFSETRYPFENLSTFHCSDPRLERIIPIAFRTLQMCSHETYMDCPYYEQLQYVGDTRLQALVTYVTSDDDRLPRKALRMIEQSRQLSGLTASRYPSRVRQVIPPFSLWWIGMVHDFALWRGDLPFVRTLMPGVRAVLDAFRTTVNQHGLLTAPDGWNYVDWVPEWPSGIPPEGDRGVSAVLNLQLALAAKHASELEDWLGEPELAMRQSKLSLATLEAVFESFYEPERGLIADDLGKTRFSEHAQALAILCGDSKLQNLVANGLLSDPDLSRTTIYFSHYLFEAFRILGRSDQIIDRLPLWSDQVGRGLRTTIEMPEPTRSDCHAWGAHPVFHNFASILGIRPVAPGMASVEISPALGSLAFAEGSIPTPFGFLRCRFAAGTAHFEIPKGISASYFGRTLPHGTSAVEHARL